MASQEKRSGKRASVTDPETRVAHCFLSSSSIINQSLRCAGGKLMDSCGFEWRQGIYPSISLRQLCMRHSWGHASMLGACAGEERRRLLGRRPGFGASPTPHLKGVAGEQQGIPLLESRTLAPRLITQATLSQETAVPQRTFVQVSYGMYSTCVVSLMLPLSSRAARQAAGATIVTESIITSGIVDVGQWYGEQLEGVASELADRWKRRREALRSLAFREIFRVVF
ncbi:hypothetical protein ACCO45_011516 [Purpureocillium lilacinum]|uniref:Uncharacterized protein n=1 Tax=Purpureocillium lilacinum TaxID=33203 RepID=A0ACC4DB20_PURLI